VGDTVVFSPNSPSLRTESSEDSKDDIPLRLTLERAKDPFPYEQLNFCFDRLHLGIQARKFHYSKQKYRNMVLTSRSADCVVKIDGKYLKWKYNKKSKFYLERQGKCPLSDITGIVFGSFSYTFLQYRDTILENI